MPTLSACCLQPHFPFRRFENSRNVEVSRHIGATGAFGKPLEPGESRTIGTERIGRLSSGQRKFENRSWRFLDELRTEGRNPRILSLVEGAVRPLERSNPSMEFILSEVEGLRAS